MTALTFTGQPVALDPDAFFTDPLQWSTEMAGPIAAGNGIPELTERHWQVIRFMRSTYLDTGTAPSIRSLGKLSGRPDQGALPALPQSRASRRW